jgi:cell division septation protein DedD
VSNGGNKTNERGDPWRNEGQVFRGAGVIVLIIFSCFVVYDARSFYRKLISRCGQEPNSPECSFLNVSRPKPPPELGIVLDQGTGKWAIQLEAMDQQSANTNLQRLGEAGATARLIKTTDRRKRSIYFLQLGRFKTQKDANEVGRQLKARGLVANFTVSSYRPTSN